MEQTPAYHGTWQGAVGQGAARGGRGRVPGRPGSHFGLHHVSSAYPSLCLSDLICERGQGVDMLGMACGMWRVRGVPDMEAQEAWHRPPARGEQAVQGAIDHFCIQWNAVVGISTPL